MSSFNGITVDSIIGDASSGVQGRFPKFIFDMDSRPSLTNVQQYTESAINDMIRKVRRKGYFPEQLAYVEDLKYVSDLIELMVASQIHIILDQGKGGAALSNINIQLESALKAWQEDENPWPWITRVRESQEQHVFPNRLRRGWKRPYPDQLLLPPISALQFVFGEVPSGAKNGSNTVFTLLNPPDPPKSLVMQLNSALLIQGTDYSVSLKTVTIINPAKIPGPSDTFIAVQYTYLMNQAY